MQQIIDTVELAFNDGANTLLLEVYSRYNVPRSNYSYRYTSKID